MVSVVTNVVRKTESNLAAVLHYPGLRIVPSDRAARCSGTGRLAGILLLRRPIHTSCRVREDRAPSQPRQLAHPAVKRKPRPISYACLVDNGTYLSDRR